MTLTGVRKSLVVYSDMRIWWLSILVNKYLRGKTEAGFRGTGEKLDAAAQPCGRANYFGQLGARPRPAQPIVPGVRRGRQYHFGQGSERRGIAAPAPAPPPPPPPAAAPRPQRVVPAPGRAQAEADFVRDRQRDHQQERGRGGER